MVDHFAKKTINVNIDTIEAGILFDHMDEMNGQGNITYGDFARIMHEIPVTESVIKKEKSESLDRYPPKHRY